MRQYKEANDDDWRFFEQCYRINNLQFLLFYHIEGKDYFFAQSNLLKNQRVLIYINTQGEKRAFDRDLREVSI